MPPSTPTYRQAPPHPSPPTQPRSAHGGSADRTDRRYGQNRPLAVAVATTALCLAAPVAAPAEFPPLALEAAGPPGGFDSPVAITNAGDGSGRLFVVEQRGQVRILKGDDLVPTPFLDLSGSLVPERPGFDERGLLGLAFHPEFGTPDAPGEGRFYAYYSAPSPDAPGTGTGPVDHRSVVSEFQVSPGDPDVADPASERVLLTFNQPQFNHDGGQLAFGPSDGFLYISTGDGGSSNDNNAGHTGGSSDRPDDATGNSQDRTNLLGKILRIDPFGNDGPGGEYGVPGDNPFAGEGGGVREEIYAYGLRNPWRMSFDTGTGGTGRLFVADVGQGRIEEINIVGSGDNLGWRNLEGDEVFAPSAPPLGVTPVGPVATYAHPGIDDADLPEIGISVTGGYVYRGSAIPELDGKYIFGDWSTGFGSPDGTLLGLEETAPGVFDLAVLDIAGGNPIGRYVPAFGTGEDGEIYVATKMTLAPSAPSPDTGLPTGSVFKVVPLPEPQSVTLNPDKDTSIYSENNNANAAGRWVFAGRTAPKNAGAVRRALLSFDLGSAVPAGSAVNSASLRLRMDKTISGSFPTALHRLLAGWGAGTSDAPGQEGEGGSPTPGDATWNHRFFETAPWSTPGGEFVEAPSASVAVGGSGSYNWTSAALASDVQGWVDDPSTNFGWILIGDESVTSAKRFLSNENASVANRPSLEVNFTPPAVPPNRQQWETLFFEPGTVPGDLVDDDGDGLNTLTEYAYHLNPLVPDPPERGLSVALSEDGTMFTAQFRRDPAATDLTYRLEATDDFSEWETLAESVAGAPATGTGSISEASPGSGSVILEVSVVDSVSVAGTPRRFVRLVIISG